MDHDLEHKILYPNLKHDDFDDVRHEEESSCSDEEPDNAETSGLSSTERVRREAVENAKFDRAERASRDPFAERRGGPHSGPKAVIADKRHSDYLASLSQDREALQRANPSLAGAGGGGAREAQRATEAALACIVAPAPASHTQQAEQGSDDEEFDEEDDEFVQQYRAQRMAEMAGRGGGRQDPHAPFASTARPSFAAVTDIHDALSMPGVIDSTPSASICLLLLWEPYIQDCLPWVRAWEELACTVPHVRWVRMRGSTASAQGMDPFGLPSVVAYKGGVEIGVEVRPQDSCGPLVARGEEGAGEEEEAGELTARQRRSTARSLATGGSTVLGRLVSTAVVYAWAEGKGWLS